MAIPTREPAFSDWVANFGTRIAALGAAIGIQPGQITAYDALYDTFVAARNAASVPGTKSRDLVTARNVAARNLLVNARDLYRIVQNFPGVTDQQRDQLGIRIVKTTRTPVAPPTAKGVLTIVSVSGRTVRVHIGNDESTDGRRLPDRAIGFSLFSFVGANAPSGA